MKHSIKILGFCTLLCGIIEKSIAQSPCFPGLPLTGTFANPATSSSPNADRVFWLTWGANYGESLSTHPYGKGGIKVSQGTKSYGSIDLGGGRYMCVEAEITFLKVGRNLDLRSYIPGTYSGDFLSDLYNIGGTTNNNRIASGLIIQPSSGTIELVIRIKATTNGEPVRLRGMVLADAESLSASESIIASGDGNWTVSEVNKNTSKGAYNIRKENNASGTQSIVYEKGNNSKTGALSFLKFRNTAYFPKSQGYAVEFSAKYTGITAIAIGLLTSGYDFGDAPESYGKPIHLIDDITLGNDGIVAGGSTVNINTTGYIPGFITYNVKRYLGSTAPDADSNDMFSADALGDDISPMGNPTSNEEDAWPAKYKRFADAEYYKAGDKITATIPYKEGEIGDKISGWIDFNLNGTFDESERVSATVITAGNGNVILEWTVPASRVAYSTYVRLRYFGSGDDEKRATGTALYGEVEDHRIYILTQGVSNPTINSKSKINY